jgi:hypothetical protein
VDDGDGNEDDRARAIYVYNISVSSLLSPLSELTRSYPKTRVFAEEW